MFILNCECGNEMFCSGEEEDKDAWQCEECGRWYDYFGYEIPAPENEKLF